MNTIWTMNSPVTTPGDIYKDKIILITQYYKSDNSARHSENVECLQTNVDNPYINEIILVTETPYNKQDVEVTSDKVKLINIGKRMRYSDAFDIVENYNVKGYVIIANSDIFFDDTLKNVYESNAHKVKKMYTQLRFEYTNSDLKKCPLFGPRGDSQDTWIFHTNYNIPKHNRTILEFELGIPGCDNHIIYVLSVLGFLLYNEPFYIRTYHNHKSNVRTYNNQTKRCISPWITIMPNINSNPNENWWKFNIVEENNRLCAYICSVLSKNQHFIIPRVAGVENNVAFYGKFLMDDKLSRQQIMGLNRSRTVMKNNAGIQLSNIHSIRKYSQQYLEAFELCDTYFGWDPWGNVYKWIRESHDFINVTYEKQRFWAFDLDVFHNIYNNPWTTALRGKRILIVSPFIASMKEKIPVLSKIYGVDLFPDCTFEFIKPPQTQGDNPSEEFDIELKSFMKRVEEIKDRFDIALCSCGGYGNLVCAEIYKIGKSAIYVGGVLQMYFGIYGNRWIRERPDILTLFKNEHWSRPKPEEHPEGFQKVEGSCYW